MPYMKNGKRDYKREVKLYTSRPEVVKKRTEQNAARRELMKEGVVKKGDGKDVDHKTPLSKGGSNARSNLRAVSSSSNRSFSRNKDGSLKSQTSRRESRKK
jgi:5-methylcytosine-specific restriction endonuclease McrA